jgi:predicted RNA polymerase sigma factor
VGTWLPARARLTSEPSLRNYHHLPSVRGELLAKLGRRDEAAVELERAASLTRNRSMRQLLLERAAVCVEVDADWVAARL